MLLLPQPRDAAPQPALLVRAPEEGLRSSRAARPPSSPMCCIAAARRIPRPGYQPLGLSPWGRAWPVTCSEIPHRSPPQDSAHFSTATIQAVTFAGSRDKPGLCLHASRILGKPALAGRHEGSSRSAQPRLRVDANPPSRAPERQLWMRCDCAPNQKGNLQPLWKASSHPPLVGE